MSRTEVLASHQGVWRGLNKLWIEDPEGEPETSPGTLTVTEDRVLITWTFRGEAQEGSCTVEEIEDSVAVVWTDSWHSEEGMDLSGEAFADAVDVFGAYPVRDGGPDWGWRIVLDLGDPERLLLRMYNISPEGDEVLVVALDGVR